MRELRTVTTLRVLPFFRSHETGAGKHTQGARRNLRRRCVANAGGGHGNRGVCHFSFVAIIAGAIGFNLNDEKDQGGYWPKGPNSSGLD